jgi:DNA helicase-2/ATP-dependent DNA helicase PcrA
MALNREQHLASRPDRGVNLVLAGAGTGKTKTLVEKVKNCLTHLNLEPENCLILTFSRKAAEEIRERVAAGIGESALRVRSGTFHSYCLALIKEHRHAYLELSGHDRFPAVADEALSRRLMLGLIRQDLGRFLGMPAGVVLGLVQRIDKLDDSVRENLENAGILEELAAIASDYRDLKRRLGYIDFEDMMAGAIDLLSHCPEVRRKELESLEYLFVDEFQDTSSDNFKLLSLILPDEGGISLLWVMIGNLFMDSGRPGLTISSMLKDIFPGPMFTALRLIIAPAGRLSAFLRGLSPATGSAPGKGWCHMRAGAETSGFTLLPAFRRKLFLPGISW